MTDQLHTAKSSSRGVQTLTDCLFALPTVEKAAECDAFRADYEATHGATDLTVRYTSTWPTEQQQWLFNNHPKMWYDGLPPFAQAFLKRELESAALAVSNTRPVFDRPAKHWIREYMGGDVRAPGEDRTLNATRSL